MVRRNVCQTMAFSNGMFIFDQHSFQVDPRTRIGKEIEAILSRQLESKVDSLPQKYRAEVAHNIDINKDGYIGKPKIVDAEIEITPESITIKPKKRKYKSKKKALVVSDSSDVSVSDSNDTVPV